MSTDAELCDRVREGSRGAFDELWRRYSPRLRAWARAVCGPAGGDPDLAADEALLALWRALSAGAGPREAVGGYLRTAVHRAAVRQVEAIRARTDAERAWEHTRATAPARIPLPGVAEPPEARQAAAALGALPPRVGYALYRREVEGYADSEIAAELGISPAALAALLYRARRTAQTWRTEPVPPPAGSGEPREDGASAASRAGARHAGARSSA